MKTFQDDREQTPTCIKLECGHAYHTRCIVRCLSSMDRKCPNCNKNKSPAEQLTREGLARKLVGELKKDLEIKFLVLEFKEAAAEYHGGIVSLKKDIKEFIVKRKEELHLNEKRKYMLDCLGKIQTTSKAVSRTKGAQYVAALHTRNMGRYWRGTSFEKLFFGAEESLRIYRLKSPRLYMPLY